MTEQVEATPSCTDVGQIHVWAWTRPEEEPVPKCWVGTCMACGRVTIEVRGPDD